MKVTFIGMGIMGSRMAANLAKNNIELKAYNRSIEKAEALKKYGAKVENNISEAVLEADVVFTMLGNPQIVRDLSSDFLKSMKERALWVDSTTVGPSDAIENAKNADERNIRFLEAPVAGTKQPAEAGELVFFVGGREEDKKEIDHLLDLMGQKSVYLGECGNAAKMKLLVNFMLAQSMLAFSEAMKMAGAIGLNEQLVSTILTNAPVSAPFLQKVKERIDSSNDETNFPLKWMSKDLGLVNKMAEENALNMDLAKLGDRLFREARENGYADKDFSSILQYLKDSH